LSAWLCGPGPALSGASHHSEALKRPPLSTPSALKTARMVGMS
jgi:hypothetical protein